MDMPLLSGPVVVPRPLTWDSALSWPCRDAYDLGAEERVIISRLRREWHVNGHATTKLRPVATTERPGSSPMSIDVGLSAVVALPRRL